MKYIEKYKKVIPVILVLISFSLIILIRELVKKDIETEVLKEKEVEEVIEENISVVLYIQDKEEAETGDCGKTIPFEIKIPKTVNVIDKSLRYLFANELNWYGSYKSVETADGVAKINVFPVSQVGLSSCQSQHLISVLSNTLIQYPDIDKIELYDPVGEKIEF